MLLEQVHIIATNVAIGEPGGNRIHRINITQHIAFSRAISKTVYIFIRNVTSNKHIDTF